MNQQRRCKAPRRGTATVELAVCLPLLVTLVMGSIQACNLLHLKNALTMAAYEASLVVSKPDTTEADVKARIGELLQGLRVRDAEVRLSPSTNLVEMPPGTEVTIIVTAPTAINTIGPEIAAPDSQLSVQAVCAR